MTPNELLLAHLAAHSDDETILRAMSGCTFGLAGEVGETGFGATTLEGNLVLFTHPEFFGVAGLPQGLEVVEASARQVAEYAVATSLSGFVLNPGSHQRFIAGSAPSRLHAPLRPPDPPEVPALVEGSPPSSDLLAAIRSAADASGVEAVWLASGPIVVTHPHPDAAFEAGLLARNVRIRSYGAEPAWTPVFKREGPGRGQARFRSLAHPLAAALAKDLAAEARRNGLAQLWAFEAEIEGQEPTLAFAYSPHPNDRFAAGFDVMHARHGLGSESPLLDALSFGDALTKIGTRLL